MGVRGGELDGYVFCCDNLYCGFSISNPVCLFIINSLNAFDVAFTCCF